jgi:hypothetical protein
VAYNRSQVQNVIDALTRAQTLDAKAADAVDKARIGIDENDDLSITNAAQVAAYVTAKRAQRDSLISQVQPVVAAWTP